jgi:hypothetical protein
MPIDMTRLNVRKTYKLYINGESAHVRFDGDTIGWNDASRSQSPYAIFDSQEMKTVWHPVGM